MGRVQKMGRSYDLERRSWVPSYLLIISRYLYNFVWINPSEEVCIILFILNFHQNYSFLHVLWLITPSLANIKYLLIIPVDVYISDVFLSLILHDQIAFSVGKDLEELDKSKLVHSLTIDVIRNIELDFLPADLEVGGVSYSNEPIERDFFYC